MQLNKFTNNLDDAPLHSSGYAEVARPNQIGSMSPQSFSQRLHIERNRQSVGKYHHSMIASGHHRNMQYQRLNSAAPGRFDNTGASTPRPGDTTTPRASGRLIADIRPGGQGFREPPARGYNPYQ